MEGHRDCWLGGRNFTFGKEIQAVLQHAHHAHDLVVGFLGLKSLSSSNKIYDNSR